MNNATLMGRLTADASVGYAGDKPVAKFTLAVPRYYDRDKTDFIRCVDWHKPEWYQNYGKKGVKLVVEGWIQTGSYEDKDGKRIYTTEINVQKKEFAESRQNSSVDVVPTTPAPTGAWMDVADGLDDVGLPFN